MQEEIFVTYKLKYLFSNVIFSNVQNKGNVAKKTRGSHGGVLLSSPFQGTCCEAVVVTALSSWTHALLGCSHPGTESGEGTKLGWSCSPWDSSDGQSLLSIPHLPSASPEPAQSCSPVRGSSCLILLPSLSFTDVRPDVSLNVLPLAPSLPHHLSFFPENCSHVLICLGVHSLGDSCFLLSRLWCGWPAHPGLPGLFCMLALNISCPTNHILGKPGQLFTLVVVQAPVFTNYISSLSPRVVLNEELT